MTDLDLDELELLEKAATPGPWAFHVIEHEDGVREEAYIEAPGDLFYFRDEAGSFTAKAYDAREPDKAFGRLVVALRNAAPSLIALAREATAARARAAPITPEDGGDD